MQYITDRREAEEIDRISIQDIGIPSMVLMERAAMAAASCIKSHCHGKERIVAICGTGNNGGDGVAAARLLWEEGFDVMISLIGDEKKASEDMKRQLSIAADLGIDVCTGLPQGAYDRILDALFGIGLSREVTGVYADAVRWINEQDALRFAVDIPSGVNASTGEVMGVAVRADFTVTFGTNKRGLVLFPGCRYAGDVVISDIGFPRKAVEQASPRAYTLTRGKAAEWMPERGPRSNKGSFGKVLVVAGSREISGACYLCAAAAYRVGCGLVKVFTASENGLVIRTRLPEALVRTYDSSPGQSWATSRPDLIHSLEQEIQWADCIVIGPGLGTDEPSGILLDTVLQERNKPVVIDADGLNLLSERDPYFTVREDGTRSFRLPGNIILTPHLREMARLVRMDLSVIQEGMTQQALASFDRAAGSGVLVLKDARTVVTDGGEIYINMTGNNALSTGGTGDVLSGMIAGLLAQGLPLMQAAVLGVYFHGAAADAYVAGEGGRYSMMAGDILDMLPKVLPR